jgi:transposase
MYLLDKDELYNYYVAEGHSREDTLKHFNVTIGILKSNLSRYGIRKDGADSNFEQYELIKTDLLDFYISQNKTLIETGKKFDMSKQSLIKLLNFWGVHKDRHNSALNSRKAYHENFVKAMPSKEEVYQYYIVEDHSRAECIEHWNTSRKVFGKWLNILGIKKAEPLPFISEEDFYDYYIAQNHKQEECAEYFCVSVSQILT